MLLSVCSDEPPHMPHWLFCSQCNNLKLTVCWQTVFSSSNMSRKNNTVPTFLSAVLSQSVTTVSRLKPAAEQGNSLGPCQVKGSRGQVWPDTTSHRRTTTSTDTGITLSKWHSATFGLNTDRDIVCPTFWLLESSCFYWFMHWMFTLADEMWLSPLHYIKWIDRDGSTFYFFINATQNESYATCKPPKACKFNKLLSYSAVSKPHTKHFLQTQPSERHRLTRQRFIHFKPIKLSYWFGHKSLK